MPVMSTLKAAELMAAAAQERSKRAEVRGRPEWWGPRAKTSTQRMLRLRPAGSPQPGADDAHQNNEPGEQFMGCDYLGSGIDGSFPVILDKMGHYSPTLHPYPFPMVS